MRISRNWDDHRRGVNHAVSTTNHFASLWTTRRQECTCVRYVVSSRNAEVSARPEDLLQVRLRGHIHKKRNERTDGSLRTDQKSLRATSDRPEAKDALNAFLGLVVEWFASTCSTENVAPIAHGSTRRKARKPSAGAGRRSSMRTLGASPNCTWQKQIAALGLAIRPGACRTKEGIGKY